MEEIGEIRTIGEASAAILAVEPKQVPLPGGRLAVVSLLDWTSSEKVWADIQGLVGLGVRAWNGYSSNEEAKKLFAETTAVPLSGSNLSKSPDGTEYEQVSGDAYGPITKATQEIVMRSQDNFAVIIDEVAKKATDLPRLVRNVLQGCVKIDGEALTPATIGELPLPWVLSLFKIALAVNFTDNPQVTDFFGGVLGFLEQNGLKINNGGPAPGNSQAAENQDNQ